MPDSRFTEAERTSQRLFMKQDNYCERFARSYGRFMSPKMIRLRRAWFQIHKWIGLILAILIIPIALSGSALVWRGWLGEQLNPQRYPAVTSELSAPSVYEEAARRRLSPGDRIASIAFPSEKGSVQVTVNEAPSGDSRPGRSWIWLDPKTSEELDRAKPGEGVVSFAHDLHGHLLMPGAGRKAVGMIGIAMLISSLTGLWLWWPLKGSFAQGFRWNRRPDFNSNVHHLGGFWIALPLAVMSATGAWISFPEVFSKFSDLEAAQVRPGMPGRPLTIPRLGVDQASGAAQRLAPGRVTNIAWPTGTKPEWAVRVKGNGAPVEVLVQDLDAMAKFAPEKPMTLTRTMERIHEGGDMPLWWQVIIFVSGILPGILAVTGILMWLRMRRRRDRNRRSAAAMAESEALAS